MIKSHIRMMRTICSKLSETRVSSHQHDCHEKDSGETRASERSAKYVSYAARQFAARKLEIYASFTFLDTTRTIHHLPVSDSQKYHPLSAVIPRLPASRSQRQNFREELWFFPPFLLGTPPAFPSGRGRPTAGVVVSSRLDRRSRPPECSCMYHGVPRAGNTISPENTKIPQSSNGAPGGFLRRAEAARATEFHEDRRTATMNISPGPRIIIRNEIALESLINRRMRPMP